jgi:site-specific DNA-methyltransferase (adenine-specific)
MRMANGSIRLLEGDCRELLATLPADSVDCIIADPPYGDTALPWDQCVAGWEAACYRVLKPSGSLWCFGSLRFFMEHRADFAGWKMAQEVVWQKHNGSGFDTDRFKRTHELAVQFYPNDRKWGEVYKCPQFVEGEARPTATIGGRKQPKHRGDIGSAGYQYTDKRMMTSVIFARSCHGHAVHPTQKPIEILTPLIEYSCPPGGMVLDPFAGSGSTLLAAKMSGRRSIGIELNPAYCNIIRDRLATDAPLLTEVA